MAKTVTLSSLFTKEEQYRMIYTPLVVNKLIMRLLTNLCDDLSVLHDKGTVKDKRKLVDITAEMNSMIISNLSVTANSSLNGVIDRLLKFLNPYLTTFSFSYKNEMAKYSNLQNLYSHKLKTLSGIYVLRDLIDSTSDIEKECIEQVAKSKGIDISYSSKNPNNDLYIISDVLNNLLKYFNCPDIKPNIHIKNSIAIFKNKIKSINYEIPK